MKHPTRPSWTLAYISELCGTACQLVTTDPGTPTNGSIWFPNEVAHPANEDRVRHERRVYGSFLFHDASVHDLVTSPGDRLDLRRLYHAMPTKGLLTCLSTDACAVKRSGMMGLPVGWSRNCEARGQEDKEFEVFVITDGRVLFFVRYKGASCAWAKRTAVNVLARSR
jgi:hypothetical protein